MKFLAIAAALGLFLSSPAQAEEPAATPPANQVSLLGKSAAGKPYMLERKARKKVAMVFVWSSDCPICIDKMKELRDNFGNWRTKPFELVGINIDAKPDQFQAYETLVGGMVRDEMRFPQLWAGDPGFFTNLDLKNIPTKHSSGLPITYIVDKSGVVVKTYRGRIPPDAWNDLAEAIY